MDGPVGEKAVLRLAWAPTVEKEPFPTFQTEDISHHLPFLQIMPPPPLLISSLYINGSLPSKESKEGNIGMKSCFSETRAKEDMENSVGQGEQNRGSRNGADRVQIIHSQVRRIKQEVDKIEDQSLPQMLETRPVLRELSRSPLGRVDRAISVGD